MDLNDQSIKKSSTDAIEVASEANLKDKTSDDKLKCKDAVKNEGDPPELPIRKALKHIRFLAMEPREFSENVFSLILSQSEILAILLNLNSKETHTPMPIGFSTNRKSRIPIKEVNDPANGKVIIRTVVSNINDLDETTSPGFEVRNKNYHVSTKMSIENKIKYLSVYLICDDNFDDSDANEMWSCKLQAEFRLLSNRVDTRSFCRKREMQFSLGDKSWGWDDFIPWTELMDPEKGYVTHDSITLEVKIRADELRVERL